MELEELLAEEGIADREILGRARERASREVVSLAAVLVDEGTVAEDVLADALARAVGTVVIDIENGELDSESVHLVPEPLARRHLLVAVARDPAGDSLRVAFANPLDATAVAVVRDLTGLGVQPLVATVSGVRAAIDRAYRSTQVMRAPRASKELAPEVTRRVESLPRASELPEQSTAVGTAPMHRLEHEATIEQRHEALLLALVEAGAIARADYLEALQRLLGRKS